MEPEEERLGQNPVLTAEAGFSPQTVKNV